MAPVNPNSRAAQVRRAEIILTRLLKTPKTRNGLIAAVASRKITRNFVFGWLTNQVISGGVVKLKSGDVIAYQIRGEVILENPALSGFPTWLDPRCLPAVAERRVFIDGLQVKSETSNKKDKK